MQDSWHWTILIGYLALLDTAWMSIALPWECNGGRGGKESRLPSIWLDPSLPRMYLHAKFVYVEKACGYGGLDCSLRYSAIWAEFLPTGQASQGCLYASTPQSNWRYEVFGWANTVAETERALDDSGAQVRYCAEGNATLDSRGSWWRRGLSTVPKDSRRVSSREYRRCSCWDISSGTRPSFMVGSGGHVRCLVHQVELFFSALDIQFIKL